MSFVQSLGLLLVGILAGAGPTYLIDRSRWNRERDAMKSERLQQVLVNMLTAATDVRRIARFLASEEDRASVDQIASRREQLDSAVAEFSEAYHALSILAPITTYQVAHQLMDAVFQLLPLADEDHSELDPKIEQLRSRVQEARRDLRDHVRKSRGLEDLGHIGRTNPPW